MSYYAIYDNEMYDGQKLDIQFTQSQISTLSLEELKELSTFARGSRKYSPRVIELSWTARVNRVNADTQDWLLDIIAMKEDDPSRILAKLSPARVNIVYEIPGTNQVAWIDGSPSGYSPKVYRDPRKNDEQCQVSSNSTLDVHTTAVYTPVDGVFDAQRNAVLVDEFYEVEKEEKEDITPKSMDEHKSTVQIVPRDQICSYLQKDSETSHLLDVLVSNDEGVGCDFMEEALPDGRVKLLQVRHLDQPVVESSKVVMSDQISKAVVDFYKIEKDRMLSSLPMGARELNRHTVVPKTSFGVSMGDIERIAHLYFGRDQIRHCVRPFAATNCSVIVRGKDFYLEFAYHGALKARAKYGPFSVGNVDYRDDTYLLLAIVQSMELFFSVRRTKPVPIFIHHSNFVNYGSCYRCSRKVFKTSYPWYVCVKCQKPRATLDRVYEDMVLVRFPMTPVDKVLFVSQRYEGCESSYFLNLRHFSSTVDGRDYTRLLRLCYDFILRCRPYSLLWCISCPGVFYRQLINDLRRMCRIVVLPDDGSFDYDKYPGKFPHKGLAPDVITWLAKSTSPGRFSSDTSLVVWALENDLAANVCGLLASMTFDSSG